MILNALHPLQADGAADLIAPRIPPGLLEACAPFPVSLVVASWRGGGPTEADCAPLAAATPRGA